MKNMAKTHRIISINDERAPRHTCPIRSSHTFSEFCTVASCMHHASRSSPDSPLMADASKCLHPYTTNLEGDEALTAAHYGLSSKLLRKTTAEVKTALLAAMFVEHVTGESVFDATDRQIKQVLQASEAWSTWTQAQGSFSDLQTSIRTLQARINSSQQPDSQF